MTEFNDNRNNVRNSRPKITLSNPSGSYKKSGNSYNSGQKADREPVDAYFKELDYNEKWISEGANEAMITFAEKAGKYMAPKYQGDKEALSKSQIRNVYGEIKRIQLKGVENVECKSSFLLLRPKVAYAEGRNKTMGLSLFKKIFDTASVNASNNKYNYLNFCNLLEAILAYHKAFGGKD